MELETGHPLCSLCRRELSDSSSESGLEAKLCNGCRDLIQTALHGNAVRAAAAASASQSEGVAYAQGGVAAPIQVDDSPAFFGDLAISPETHEQQTPQIDFFNLNHGSFEMDFEDDASEMLGSDLVDVEAPVPESTEHHDEAPIEPTLATETNHNESPSMEDHPSAQMSATLSELHSSLSESGNSGRLASLATNPLTQPGDQSIAEDATTDPWVDPLPAWDYSRNEYPVLMGPPREKSFAKYKVPFAVLLILGFGAAFYYLIYPQLREQQPTVSAPFVPTPDAASNSNSAPSKAQSTASDTASTTQAKPAQQSDRQVGVASEPNNSQGRFALQAAAFPTQDGADELAGKLKEAGLPSYVVSADLPRRGKWFRVRVGRFNTAEEAQRFAAEAQSRAKAAGIALQLIVSPYEQP